MTNECTINKNEIKTVKKEDIINNVKNRTDIILKFLGYVKREAPEIIKRKVKEELNKFENYIDIEYEYKIFEEKGKKYADIIYTIGNRLEDVIQGYIADGTAMKAMIMDKIGVVTLDEIKEGIIKELYDKYGVNVTKEGYPGSKKYGLILQKEIFEKMENIKNITINEYYQLFPVKSVALRLELSEKVKFYNPCGECDITCDIAQNDEEAAYKFFLKKSENYTKKLYEDMKLPESMYYDNIKDIEIWAKRYKSRNGTKGIDKKIFSWINSILEMKVIKIGRLQFEILEYIDEKLENILRNEMLEDLNDFLFINAHIREDGKLTESECEESYNMAKKYFFGELSEKIINVPKKVLFFCDSWLINPYLKKILPEKSNILKFQKKYNILYVNKDEKNSQIIERVFEVENFKWENINSNNDNYSIIRDFPEKTYLQKKLKESLEKGEKFFMTKGYFIESIL